MGLDKRILCIASMGAFGALFAFVALTGPFLGMAKALLELFGVFVFVAAAVMLYREWDPGTKMFSGGEDFLDAENLRDSQRITQVDFLNEEGKVIRTWELYGHVSMLIGRDVGENQVDINLSDSPYASMVDMEHAVLNYADGSWYIEDLGSKNGVLVQKAVDGRRYRLSSDRPCKLVMNDIVRIGLCELRLH